MNTQMTGRAVIEFTRWTKDTPPSGWHFASAGRNPELLRFWDGMMWSEPVHESASETEFERVGRLPDMTVTPSAVWWRTLTAESLAWLHAEGALWHGETDETPTEQPKAERERRAAIPAAVAVDRIIWRQELQQTLGVSLETISRYLRTPGKLPPPDVNLNAKSVGWRVSTLHAAGVNVPA